MFETCWNQPIHQSNLGVNEFWAIAYRNQASVVGGIELATIWRQLPRVVYRDAVSRLRIRDAITSHDGLHHHSATILQKTGRILVNSMCMKYCMCIYIYTLYTCNTVYYIYIDMLKIRYMSDIVRHCEIAFKKLARTNIVYLAYLPKNVHFFGSWKMSNSISKVFQCSNQST